MNATFSPNWSQSGEELLRAWEVRYGQKCDGVLAIDLQGLARLMSLTGPVTVPGVGELNAGNLVKVLAGSYDTYNMPAERRAINAALVPAFREKLFQGGGQLTQKFQVLLDAAKGRHFAMYFRDHRLQDAFVQRRLDGDLSTTDHDYLGVFTQNTKGSKSDYWQKRIVDSDVKLRADGSADVTLTVTVQNPSPPYVHGFSPDDDPRSGYYTRWAGNSIAVFLPKGAEIQGQARIRNLPFKPIVRSVLDRPYFTRKVLLEPQAEAVLQVTYRVPDAATVDGDSLVYDLSIDPQSTVVPEQMTVTLHVPEGYGLSETPVGWQMVNGRTLTYFSPGLNDSPHWTVDFSKL